MLRALNASIAVSLLSGCAYLTTYKSDIGSPSTGVAMDAKQRLMLVNTVGTARRLCAEPSPDALSSIGASLGASFLSDPGSAKQLAAALGESSASIGLRTTSIQLMRDAMYRACEAYLSGGISPEEYADLQAHSQTLVVGLLAIEQLTGAVQAQQVAVISNSAAGGIPDVAAEADNLTQAKKATLAQQQLADEAATKKAAAAKAADSKQAEVDAAKKDAKVKPEDLAKLETDLGDLRTKATAAAKDDQAQAGLLEIQKQAEGIAQQAFDLARTRVRATVSGDAKFSQQTRGNTSEAMAATTATAITKIVETVVGQSVETQKCRNLMSRPLGDLKPEQLAVLIRICDTVSAKEETRNELTRRQFNLQPAPPPRPAPN